MTVRFYLVRHGKAEPQGSGPDAERPLTAKGRARFLALAEALGSKLAAKRIATSPLVRARETAYLLAGVTGVRVEEDEALASGASTGRGLLALGARLGAGAVLVGHNPEIAEAIAIAAGRETEVKPGAVAAIDASKGGFTLGWIRGPG